MIASTPSTVVRPRWPSPLGVLDLDHLGSPVREDRARRGHEGELGHLEDAHAPHRLQHQ